MPFVRETKRGEGEEVEAEEKVEKEEEEEDHGGWEGDKWKEGGIKEKKVSSTQRPFLNSQISDLSS